jgi:hypothetical protein
MNIKIAISSGAQEITFSESMIKLTAERFE